MSALKQDLHLPVDHPRRVGLDWSIRPGPTRARAHVEPPAVKWTDHLAILQKPRSQRTTAVRAEIVRAVELAIQIPKCELATPRVHRPAFTRPEARSIGDGNELAHDFVGGSGLVDDWPTSPDLGRCGGFF